MIRLAAAVALALVAAAGAPRPRAQDPGIPPVAPLPAAFDEWLNALRAEALSRGLREEVLDRALAGVQPVPQILERDRSQAEFTLDLGAYLKRRLTRATVTTAQRMYTRHRALLKQIDGKYGVNP